MPEVIYGITWRCLTHRDARDCGGNEHSCLKELWPFEVPEMVQLEMSDPEVTVRPCRK